MKRLIAILIAALFLLSAAGCSALKKAGQANNNDSKPEQQESDKEPSNQGKTGKNTLFRSGLLAVNQGGGNQYGGFQSDTGQTGKWGYIDPNGNIVIELKYDFAMPFAENGLAGVKLNGKWGFINNKDEFVIQPTYDEIKSFSNGYAAVRSGNYWGYINESGEMTLQPFYAEAHSFSKFGLAVVAIGTVHRYSETSYSVDDIGYAVIDTSGNFLIEPQDYQIFDYAPCGLARFAVPDVNTRYGYFDTNGKVKIDSVYYNAGDFDQDGTATVKNEEGAYRLIDANGKDIGKASGKHYYASNGLRTKRDNNSGLEGYVDRDGNTVIDFQYTFVLDFTDFGLAGVCYNCDDGTCRWRFIDSKGKTAFELEPMSQAFSQVKMLEYHFYDDGFAVVMNYNGDTSTSEVALIDSHGNYIVGWGVFDYFAFPEDEVPYDR